MLKKILQAIVFVGTIGLCKIRINRKDGSKFSFDLLSTGPERGDLSVYHVPDDDEDPTNDTYFVAAEDSTDANLPDGAICIGKLIYVSDQMGFTPDALLRTNLLHHVSSPS